MAAAREAWTPDRSRLGVGGRTNSEPGLMQRRGRWWMVNYDLALVSSIVRTCWRAPASLGQTDNTGIERLTFAVTIMKKVKTIRILRFNRYPVCETEEPTPMYVDDENNFDVVDQWQPPTEDEQTAATNPDDSSDVITDTGNPPLQRPPGDRVRPADLLLKELDEIYDWARLGCQLCFALCTLYLAINAVAIGWLTTSNRAFVFFLFIVFNVVGALTTVFLGKYLLQCDQRVSEVIWMLTQHRETDDPWSWPRSAVPRTAIKILFIFTAFALIVLLVVWTGLFVAAI